ncbi:hypothetical protein GCM10023324_47480 [Streptomyces youssoufiensis]
MRTRPPVVATANGTRSPTGCGGVVRELCFTLEEAGRAWGKAEEAVDKWGRAPVDNCWFV